MAPGSNVSLAIFGRTAPYVAFWLIRETGSLLAGPVRRGSRRFERRHDADPQGPLSPVGGV